MSNPPKISPEEARQAQEAKNAKLLGIIFAVFLIAAIGAMFAIDVMHEKRLEQMGMRHDGPSDAADR